MSFFLLLLLFLFVFFVLVPVIKVAWTVHKMRKQAQSMFDQMTGASGPRQQSGRDPFDQFFTNMARERSERTKKRKKIGADVGEYVEFQEISVKIEEAPQAVDFIPESQISDAEWEDIPKK